MPIPRLPADADDFTFSITVNKNLRPYFTIWYQRKKKAGETPEQFALRYLKASALNEHILDAGKAEAEIIEQAKADALQALSEDAKTLDSEL